MIIPHQQLEPDTLQNLIEDFVSREGTDNGDESTELQKVQAVRSQLASGQAVIYFDAEYTQCILASRDQVPKAMLGDWQSD
ncbi:YheU family protein [Pseudomonas sp. P66]|uniref:YheU family protein n=1 Tax=Pseudomonas arcuscaelestis TaxID=2710591 RepID=A0ABS2BZ55_9PSED|nr:YheU family protein [Pseudomonas arcuscaelestis]MBM5458887.1 YheU family protein [Pseudomonas arcuscaelestis]